MEDRLRVGVITTTHGIKGEVKVFPTTDDLERFKTLDKCYLTNGKTEIEAHCVSAKFFKNQAILKFKEYDNINDIEFLRNYDILVDREDAVALEEGEFFICDIIGAIVYDQDNNVIGHIDEVLETAANQVFVIKDEKGNETLVPVVKAWVDEVDTVNKIVRVHMYKVAED